MKYIKTYEKWALPFFKSKAEPKPKIGDYVICDYNSNRFYNVNELLDFIKNNIGIITEKYFLSSDRQDYY